MTDSSIPRVILMALMLPLAATAQDSSKVAIVNFERVVAESVEGKKASEQFGARLTERRGAVDKKQKELEDAENRLRTQERALSDAAKAELARTVETRKTEIQRISEDAEAELGALREQLLGPIAEKAQRLLNSFALEQGFTLIVDVSNPQSGVLWAAPSVDVTAELVKRMDTPATPPRR